MREQKVQKKLGKEDSQAWEYNKVVYIERGKDLCSK